MSCCQFHHALTRRDMLRLSAGGFAHLALAAMAGNASAASAARAPHVAPRAKRIIFLFMWGGPSHVDLFDPKPKLGELDGRPLHGSDVGSEKDALGTIMGSPFKFAPHGESGIWMSELLPELARHADKLCVIRSLHTEGTAHGEALLRLHTGAANLVRPSVGAWVSYGLGSESDNLPAFITISPPRGHGGVQNYGSAFLPPIHQGTAIGSAEIPISDAKVANLVSARGSSSAEQRARLDLAGKLSRRHTERVGADPAIEGLIESHELAFRMQSTMPAVMSLDGESSETLARYGIGSEPSDNFGRQCLLARRFAEQGVRYIQVSTDYTWDHHTKVRQGHIDEAAKVDRPIAGLLEDLQQRGMLDDTLVLWGGEFGRTPMAENTDGRGHHPQVFTAWMAGGGVKGGLTYGTTDEFGFRPAENPVHMHDLHATLLHTLGLDHTKLTYTHAGREFRLTDVYGSVIHEVLA